MGLFIWMKNRRLDQKNDASILFRQPGQPGIWSGKDSTLDIKVAEKAGHCATLNLKGVLDSHTSHALEEELQKRLKAKCIRIVIDMHGLTYVGSRGWGTLISQLKTVRRQGGDFKLSGMKPSVKQIFIHAGLANIFESYEQPAEAWDAFATNRPPLSEFQ